MISAVKTLRGSMVTSLILALCLCAAGAAFAQTTPAQNAPAQGNSVQGTVASVDSTKNTFVVNSRSGDPTTVQTSDKTKITKSTNIGIAGLKAGDLVTVNGTVDATALTVAARRITVRAASANPPAGGGQGGGAGAGNGRSLRGTVAATTPKLTVTGEDGKTYTVTPDSDTIQVLAPAPGTFADITAGANVRVRGSADASGTVTADSVEIRPAGGRRGGGGAGGGGAGGAQQPPAQ